ncbi:uncharacterized protein A1O9_03983 [Exophiala aquamarina CBS 119918]|uniref:Carboxypeptidase D n=1 Tax=Exophiala aquamarina CBS 119918 TaxID=1182545 RepID=A0A072PG68_9EURO|nr:uncharacterized protein A1O9_03983 [Exophiala aquamarina CBS 119918]KEF59139.1 hypothetical protein A1O9_03983 [Exophiala aquamarina CBS 119918]
MLYLDQPVQVGLSYDTLQNITIDLISGDFTLLNETDTVPEQNLTFKVGTYPSQEPNSTSSGNLNGARALWHFAQTWFQEFPGYTLMTAVSIENGTWTDEDGEEFILHLDILLVINGCIDRQVQWPSYSHIAFNTYGIKTVNKAIYQQMNDAYYGEGGCRDRINKCRALSLEFDPDQRGVDTSVNKICQDAETFWTNRVRDPYLDHSGGNYYDFAAFDPDPFPAPWYVGWLNQHQVQRALGVPLNFTQSSSLASTAFRSIGDYPRTGWLEDLTHLLDNGIKVALVYGDRDFACNWIGGEAVSLAINHTHTQDFHEASYQPIHANESYVGGQVRQYGNLSFSRVYESGHEVPSYQPETAYKIFHRALFNLDISTGEVDTAANGSYSTTGLADTWAFKNEDPPELLWVCYSYDPTATCTEDQMEALLNGSAVAADWILENENSTNLYPSIFT